MSESQEEKFFRQIDKAPVLVAANITGIELHLGEETYLSFYSSSGKHAALNMTEFIRSTHGTLVKKCLTEWIEDQRKNGVIEP